MPSVFTRIINGEFPGRFVWRDDQCVAFLTINPLKPGHTLVVPRAEVDHWIDMDESLVSHLNLVALKIGKAIDKVFSPAKVGVILAGLEVPHVHIHVLPIWSESDLNFANAEREPDPAALDDAAEKIRAELKALGFREVSE